MRLWLRLDQANSRRFQALSALNNIEDDGLPFSKAREPGLFAVVWPLDEADAYRQLVGPRTTQ